MAGVASTTALRSRSVEGRPLPSASCSSACKSARSPSCSSTTFFGKTARTAQSESPRIFSPHSGREAASPAEQATLTRTLQPLAATTLPKGMKELPKPPPAT